MVTMEYTNVSLCRFGSLSCFGCCGHDFGKKEEILLAIKKNNFDFEDKTSLSEFMKREDSLRECGLCRNVVNLPDGTLGCPGHPKQTSDGSEIRTCDILFECKKAFLYRTTWTAAEKKEFHEKIKDMDSVDYSMFMSDDKR